MTLTLLRNMNRENWRVSLIVVDGGENVYFQNDIPANIEYIDLGCKRVRQALPRLIKLLWKAKPTLVFSTLGHLNLALAMVRFFLPNNTVYVARETNIVSRLNQFYSMPKLWGLAYRLFYPRFDRVICQSRDMAQDLVEGFAFPQHKIRLVHNPVDVQRVLTMAGKPDDDSELAALWSRTGGLKLVAAGRLAPEKGFDLLIDALALCRDLPVTVFVLGEGALRAGLTKQIESRDLVGRVVLCGFQPNPYPYLAGADAFVLSSRFEGLPNVVLEALACRTPVVALPAPGGIDELLGGVRGCVVGSEVSAWALAQALREWAASDRRRLGADAVARFEVGPIMQRYESVFREALEQHVH